MTKNFVPKSIKRSLGVDLSFTKCKEETSYYENLTKLEPFESSRIAQIQPNL
ncbi:hypothetical protein LEP1GSC083_1999 [Leptospira interrogans serovar Pyrogenes str. L0374]|uniref:Uncharacterized protein n=3 Tax=Leptospira interrogans TaxID=173 RepID=M6KA85_LEPIR|nr:hypothetical protein G436_2350 [Leptospira interrogans serovar Hardjo str. Norma]EKO96138.1 hypothetical protein LEP1GSC057_1819 [Leptospira interrogans str. Brem 329]EKP87673.1 hypothetical protein LEP1GSC020_1870 [Leptospira interrogans serovar Grippotyphosa str. 2006006986]EMM83975.1 hypothetical protein LEP1GSC037_4662 [Leptospira interrogans str. 2006001854]EMN31079.1 hypothetical protein LEP1GSC083_1999 [Leptospira interrogans serovar Pyrogenes str. L0374]EMN60614.1 hypothetical prote